ELPLTDDARVENEDTRRTARRYMAAPIGQPERRTLVERDGPAGLGKRHRLFSRRPLVVSGHISPRLVARADRRSLLGAVSQRSIAAASGGPTVPSRKGRQR